MHINKTKIIILISGKRKSGKDFLADLIYKSLGSDVSAIIHLSAPLKYAYAQENGISYDKLLDSSAYKESYRFDMIKFGQDIRQKNPYFFCKAATTDEQLQNIPVWIISDPRYKTDISYFVEHYPQANIIKLRVIANNITREYRGWKYTSGVDDIASECELDQGVTWDLIVHNDCRLDFEQSLQNLLNRINSNLYQN